MIEKIEMKQVASFGEQTTIISELKTINVFYGENGAGKSTIGKFLSNQFEADFHGCNVWWKDGIKNEIYVYNKDFVDITLRETKIKGVFTLGKESAEIKELVSEATDIRNYYHGKLSEFSKNIESNKELILSERIVFNDKCWDLKNEYDNIFKDAFKGFRNSKEQFAAKCIESISQDAEIGIENLVSQARVVFSEKRSRMTLIPEIVIQNVQKCENEEIYRKKIVGRADVPVSELINRLNNSDWVRQGLTYFHASRCPFCQQQVSLYLREQLELFFDESYANAMKELSEKNLEYSEHSGIIVNELELLREYSCEHFNFESINSIFSVVKAKISKNLEIIKQKQKEPSVSVQLDSILPELNDILGIIKKANLKIIDHNALIDNIESEKLKLTEKIWKFLGKKLFKSYNEYQNRVSPLQHKLEIIRRNIKIFTSGYKETEDIINECEKSITGIVESQESINLILRKFGFTNFKIVDDGQGCYIIQRENGSLARETLSEGERTFISFLYFFHLIRGGTSASLINKQKIIVFDDPVSSLDCKVLFVISSLIRSLFLRQELAKFNIKQIVIFTHNVYFHKEITFLGNLRKLGNGYLKATDFAFWIIRKERGVSSVAYFKTNPIKTSYHALWTEVKLCKKESGNSVAICNTLRRILENFLCLLGVGNLDGIIDKFEGDEQIVVRSLLSWMHDGSHSIYDNVEMGSQEDLTRIYLPVFREIFVKLGHLDHYEMMIEECM